MSSSRRIGVLTFHRCINYGSYWQARCLVEGLRARGEDAVLLEHDSTAVTRTEWRCAFQPLLPRRVPRSALPLYAAKTRSFLDAFDALPRSAPFDLDHPSGMERFDLVMVGSDEVWNLSHPWYGGRGIFWGAGLNAERVVSYAASFGNYDADAGLEPYWADRLRCFDAISVRDENSRRLVHDALGCDPDLVLDPCLQFADLIPRAPGDRKASYLALYGHGLPDWFAREVRSWAHANSLRIVSIGYHNDWADEQVIAAGPDEFTQLIAGASAVATNFFHGCIFALVNEKPFVVAPSGYRFNKVRDMTSAVGADDYLVTEATDSAHYAQILGSPQSPVIGERIAALREQSTRYLDRILD